MLWVFPVTWAQNSPVISLVANAAGENPVIAPNTWVEIAAQPSAATGPQAPCGGFNDYTYYTFAAWQQSLGEDLQSVVQNPGFTNPAYPADDYSLSHGSPAV